MKTLHLSDTQHDIERAAAILREGGLVAMPTETVYGLAADALSGSAVRRIFEAKGRPMDNPLIVHIADVSDIDRLELAAAFPEKARRLAEAFWPGPLTIILPKGRAIPDEVSAGLDTVALRLPAHPAARELIRVSGLALAAPSANTSGKPSPTTARHVADDMDGKIDAILDGGACGVGVESTVITLVSDTPRILRPGVITPEDISAVIGEVEVDKAVRGRLEKGETAASPGMKYKHYAPRAKVILLRGSIDRFITYVNRRARRSPLVAAMCYEEDIERIDAQTVSLGSVRDEKDQAKRLFTALREVDHMSPDTVVYAPCPNAEGVGLALYNRLIRAAAFEVIDLPEKRVIGLTGQTGSGKSEVSRLLSCRGLPVVSADNAARLAVEDGDVKRALCEAFGNVLLPDGSLDRKLTAKIAFSSPENTATLNEITHPRIARIMLEEAEKAPGDIVVFDASQLFESGEDAYCDVIVSVIADREIRVKRLMERDGLSSEEIELRMSAQLSEEFFMTYSDDIIVNNGSAAELETAVDGLYERLVRQ